MNSFQTLTTPEAAVDRAVDLYTQATEALHTALEVYFRTGKGPDEGARRSGAFCYPELRVTYRPAGPPPKAERSFARFNAPGVYATSLTRPDLFRTYIIDQLGPLMRDFGATIEVGVSSDEIPYPYVLDGLAGEEDAPAELVRLFPSTNLAHIGDEIVDGVWNLEGQPARPLALFDGRRVDYSLHRLKHYTGTPPEHVQKYILFTNYQRYVDAFVKWGTAQIGSGGYTAMSCPGGLMVDGPDDTAEARIASLAPGRYQMPAYHLMREDGLGLTMVNIGVGPSNAKTITDHLAVMRPEAWLMIGHCGGLRPSQTIGDYVLAHAYLRDDHVLDDVLPPEIPIPPIAEVQRAMEAASSEITGETEEALKRRLRTGTVVTTDDRNWELRYAMSALRFNQSRAVAIDMESATIAAQGYRFRVPYGTLLCVSDKPLHGEIKMPAQAGSFYNRAVSEHIRIGIATVDLLRKAGPKLHSRKLRSFDEPPFR